jgi:hypothetical protein
MLKRWRVIRGSLALARACVDEKKLRSLRQIAASDFVVYTPLARAAESRAARADQSLRPKNSFRRIGAASGIQN